MQTAVDLDIADGTYTFKIGLAQALEIERRCGPIGEVAARLLKGTAPSPIDGRWFHNPLEAGYGIQDVRVVILQGLIGGARGYVDGQGVEVPQHRAVEIVERYVDTLPLTERWKLARAIVYALCEGYEPPEKKKGDEVKPSKRQRRPKTATSPA